MTITFKYKNIERPDGTKVETPSIPIILSGKENFETLALLDSGADLSVISKELAEILGLDLSGKRTPSFGVGGKIDSIDSNIIVIIEKGHEKYKFNIPIKVILGRYDLPVLLGRAGFFDKFIISFKQKEGKVSLKKINK